MQQAKTKLALAVAAGFLTPALPADAAEKIHLKLGGYSKWWLVAAQSDNDFETATNAAYSNTDVKGDNEVHFIGSTVLDNGVKMGVKIELEGGGHTTTNTDTIDKSFAWVEGGFGKLELGSDYNAASLAHVAAPDAAGLWAGPPQGLASDTIIPRPSAVSTMYSGNQTGLDHDDNAEKILYFTPAFHGLTLAVSYTPSALSEDDSAQAIRSQVFAAGLSYGGTVGPVALALSAGWLGGHLSSASAEQNDVRAVSVGGQATFLGITIGGSYGNERHDLRPGAAKAGTIDHSGRSWDVGLQYETGPASVSAAYYNSKVEGLMSNPDSDRIDIVQMSGKYTLGPGVAVMGSVGRIVYDDETPSGDAANHNQGYAVMTGMGLWF
ncbi:conserved exported hypothetical protein [Magnetospirillum sp. LM-5]|uniref:porin n=1 Tax=Magnetospirillum sp. LM-5 TaxID=2681466 RepID=UPI001385CF5C|nr:porin [Magnetospirillum sp. LM-5]CAA7615274.1 conserved exported hypothetical protein [Magnetospirillum sp. LM-5]